MKRRKMRHSVFWQLIILLSGALIVLMLILSITLLKVHARQVRADREYFQIETQTIANNLEAKLQEFKVVVAQLSENNLMQAFLTEQNTLERWHYSQYVQDLLRILLSNNSQILSVDLFWLDGKRYTITNTDWQLSLAVQAACDVSDPEDVEVRFMLIRPSKSMQYSRFAYVAPVYSLDSGAKLATVALYGTCGRLTDAGTDECVQTYLMDSWGNCYPEADSIAWDAQAQLPYDASVGFVRTSAYVDVSQNQYTATAVVLAAVMVLTLILTGGLLIHQLTHPVLTMSRQMEMVKRGAKNSVQITSGGVELASLCDGINEMLETIEQRNRENMQVQDQLYQAELARVEAQLYALRNQINPHFLYNTLQTVRGMAVYHGVPEIGRIATNMAYIFRYAVREEPMAQAREEMVAARKFVEIMNARQNGKYVYSEFLDPALECSMVPRMIVQPVIENSIKYAFEAMDEGARISVKWYREGEDVLIVLEDNGCGMEEKVLEALIRKMHEPFSKATAREAGGLGLHNIHQRLRLRYGEKYGATVESRAGAGTRVVLRMPGNSGSEEERSC